MVVWYVAFLNCHCLVISPACDLYIQYENELKNYH
ncbi:hypothetical protein GLYMA_14G150051v4 [Glycine max]|nr:hypothetical protein GLYMA_14G150051v4 [Glycine max]KAH1094562.1 hypothetical protein GYH30_040027 [Glycine max]